MLGYLRLPAETRSLTGSIPIRAARRPAAERGPPPSKIYVRNCATCGGEHELGKRKEDRW